MIDEQRSAVAGLGLEVGLDITSREVDPGVQRSIGKGEDASRAAGIAHIPTATAEDDAFGGMMEITARSGRLQLRNRFKRSRCADPFQNLKPIPGESLLPPIKTRLESP